MIDAAMAWTLAAGDARFGPVADAAAPGAGIEIILIVFGAALTLALLAFFIYVFTRKEQ